MAISELMPRYIYVRDDMERPVFSEDEPVAFDLELARTGMLAIIRTGDWHCMGRSGSWEPIEEAVLAPREIDEDGNEMPPFHVAAASSK
jgi:hypothetical protein